MQCDRPNCQNRAVGWRTLKDGGSARVGTCEDHTDPKLLERLAPLPEPKPRKRAQSAPAKPNEER